MTTITMDEILERTGALLKNDHFVYSSGKHGDIYINKNDLFAHTEASEQAGKLFAETYQDLDIDSVIGPAICGIIPAHWTAYHLSHLRKKKVCGVFGERDSEKNFFIGRGYDQFVKGKNILIIDDIATSGSTLKKFINTVRTAGGNIMAAAVMVNRNPTGVNSAVLGIPFGALTEMDIPTYPESDCPFCRDGIPINTEMGHGREYLKAAK
ncbi:MAG: phosphoribosyltransferase [Cyanobacteria bacterium]|nr:phosphoribosyltransferase [Cyanobacteriota bacterium]